MYVSIYIGRGAALRPDLCLCMYVCAYMYVCVYIHINSFYITQICVCVCVCVYVYVSLCVRAYVGVYIHTYIQICIYIYIYVLVHVTSRKRAGFESFLLTLDAHTYICECMPKQQENV